MALIKGRVSGVRGGALVGCKIDDVRRDDLQDLI